MNSASMKPRVGAVAVLLAVISGFASAQGRQTSDTDPYRPDDITIVTIPVPKGGVWVPHRLPTDSDGDGILDIIERASLCLDPNDPDTDHDGIPDGVEIGTYNGFDFKAAGANPCRRDIFVELDAEQRTVGSTVQDAQFGSTLQQALIDFYAGLPIANADGSTGITLHLYPSDVLAANYSCSTMDSPFSYPDAYFHKAELCLHDGTGSKGKGEYGGQRFHIVGPPVNGDPTDDSTEAAQYTWYWLFL